MPQPKDKDWLNVYKNKTPIYAVYKRDPPQNKGHIQTESEGLEKGYFTQFSSVAQSCPTHCNPVNRSTPGLHVYHKLLEFTQTHAH